MPRERIEAIYEDSTKLLNDRTTGHFSDIRMAVLFKPGTYDADILVGYYTQVLGLGKDASDVTFTGERGVYCEAMDKRRYGAGSLDTFWRSAENFKARPQGTGGMMWAVSQAAPLRRIHVASELHLHDGESYASGGFMANMQVDKGTFMASQQQWMTRASTLNPDKAEEMGGAWSFVFVGTTGAPAQNYPRSINPGRAYNNVEKAPVCAEKPFISIDVAGRYSLNIPKVRFDHSSPKLADIPPGSASPELNFNKDLIESVPFERVFVAAAEYTPNAGEPQFGTWATDDHAKIQAALDDGKHVVLSPGIFNLKSPLVVRHPNQVILGIGMATLVAPGDGAPCIKVAPGVGGVRIAGVMLQAALVDEASYATSTLLEWGDASTADAGDPLNPGFLFDVFARVGGPDADRAVRCHTIARLNSGHVVGDNLWLWRADHSKLAEGEARETRTLPTGDVVTEEYHLVRAEFKCQTALDVRGDDVTVYGLAAEHTLGDQVAWRGERGAVYFYQCELPYDVDTASFGAVPPAGPGYVGYRVDSAVRAHTAVGAGVYSFFRDYACAVPAGIAAPLAAPGVRFVNPFKVKLVGHDGIQSAIADNSGGGNSGGGNSGGGGGSGSDAGGGDGNGPALSGRLHPAQGAAAAAAAAVAQQ